MQVVTRLREYAGRYPKCPNQPSILMLLYKNQLNVDMNMNVLGELEKTSEVEVIKHIER